MNREELDRQRCEILNQLNSVMSDPMRYQSEEFTGVILALNNNSAAQRMIGVDTRLEHKASVSRVEHASIRTPVDIACKIGECAMLQNAQFKHAA